MGPLLHIGLTTSLLAATEIVGFKISAEVAAAAIADGFFWMPTKRLKF